MREAESKEIKGRTYRVRPLPAGAALRVAARLGKLLGPAVANVIGAAPAKAEGAPEGAIDETSVAGILSAILDRLDPEQLDALCRDLAAGCLAEKEPGSGKFVDLPSVFDVHFSGRLDELVLWVVFALEVNFGPLFGMLGTVRSARSSASTPAADPSR